jgi:predicted regulator of Ras-like GTPase activity (Roadblock/LC7/MglB family)
MNESQTRLLIQRELDGNLSHEEETRLRRVLMVSDSAVSFRANLSQVVAAAKDLELPDAVRPGDSSQLAVEIIENLPVAKGNFWDPLFDIFSGRKSSKTDLRSSRSVASRSQTGTASRVAGSGNCPSAVSGKGTGQNTSSATHTAVGANGARSMIDPAILSPNKEAVKEEEKNKTPYGLPAVDQYLTGTYSTVGGLAKKLRKDFGNTQTESVGKTLADAIREKVHESYNSTHDDDEHTSVLRDSQSQTQSFDEIQDFDAIHDEAQRGKAHLEHHSDIAEVNTPVPALSPNLDPLLVLPVTTSPHIVHANLSMQSTASKINLGSSMVLTVAAPVSGSQESPQTSPSPQASERKGHDFAAEELEWKSGTYPTVPPPVKPSVAAQAETGPLAPFPINASPSIAKLNLKDTAEIMKQLAADSQKERPQFPQWVMPPTFNNQPSPAVPADPFKPAVPAEPLKPADWPTHSSDPWTAWVPPPTPENPARPANPWAPPPAQDPQTIQDPWAPAAVQGFVSPSTSSNSWAQHPGSPDQWALPSPPVPAPVPATAPTPAPVQVQKPEPFAPEPFAPIHFAPTPFIPEPITPIPIVTIPIVSTSAPIPAPIPAPLPALAAAPSPAPLPVVPPALCPLPALPPTQVPVQIPAPVAPEAASTPEAPETSSEVVGYAPTIVAVTRNTLPIEAIGERINQLFSEPTETKPPTVVLQPVKEVETARHENAAMENDVKECLSSIGRLADFRYATNNPGHIKDLGRFLLTEDTIESIGNCIGKGQGHSNARVVTLEAAQQLAVALEPVLSTRGVAGYMVCGYDGLPISSNLPAEVDMELLGGCALVTFMNSHSIMKVMGHTKINQMICQTPGGCMLLADFGKGFLVTVTNERDAAMLANLTATIASVSAE